MAADAARASALARAYCLPTEAARAAVDPLFALHARAFADGLFAAAEALLLNLLEVRVGAGRAKAAAMDAKLRAIVPLEGAALMRAFNPAADAPISVQTWHAGLIDEGPRLRAGRERNSLSPSELGVACACADLGLALRGWRHSSPQ